MNMLEFIASVIGVAGVCIFLDVVFGPIISLAAAAGMSYVLGRLDADLERRRGKK